MSVAACAFIVVPTTEFSAPSHQSHVTDAAPMSTAPWLPPMPPPFWTKSMIAARSAGSNSVLPDALLKKITSYWARFAVVKIAGLNSAPRQVLPLQSFQSTA